MDGRIRRFVGLVVCSFAAGAPFVGPTAALADDNSIAYQGEVDTAGPLVMDTANGNDPQTYDLTSVGNADVVMIQRMPVTKTITAITLGDLAVPTTCTGSPTVALAVVNQGTKGFDGTTWTNASDYPPITSTLGRITWHMGTPLTLLAGKAYSFRISFYANPGGCSVIRQTTWAHNSSKVEAVPDNGLHTNTCQTGVPLGSGRATSSLMRQWHVLGGNEPNFPCISGGGAALESSYPTGWLVSFSTNGSVHRIATYTAPSSSTQTCQNTWPTYMSPIAAFAQFWRTNPSNPANTDYACYWPEFYDYGYKSRYGWWYATPFRPELPGKARAMYVKLDVIDYESYLRDYAPALKYDSREPFYAMSADSITNSWQPATDWWNYSNTLQGSPGAYIAAANPFAPDVDTLTLDTLGYSYAGPTIGGIVAQSGDFLDEIESGPDAYQSTSQGLYQTSGYADHAYGRAYQGPDGSMWLQYWFWYYYNDGRFDGYFDHEGDWENVQVKLTPNASNTGFAPVSATYAMHTERATCNWSVVPITNGQHPVVYPSFGRHASYFTPDKTINGDQNDALGALVPLAITPIHSYTNWVRWPGRWGSTTRSDIPLYNKLESDSPTGPAQHTQWSDPAGWDGGDSRTDKCPVVGVIISRRGHRRFHSRDYGRGPVIRVRLLRDHRVRVAWRLRTPADRVILSVRSVSTTAPASTDVTRNHWRRRGAMSLQLPHVEGPFAVSGTSVRRHRFSQETVVRVGT